MTGYPVHYDLDLRDGGVIHLRKDRVSKNNRLSLVESGTSSGVVLPWNYRQGEARTQKFFCDCDGDSIVLTLSVTESAANPTSSFATVVPYAVRRPHAIR